MAITRESAQEAACTGDLATVRAFRSQLGNDTMKIKQEMTNLIIEAVEDEQPEVVEFCLSNQAQVTSQVEVALSEVQNLEI